ncbi:keratin, type I cytoskeletal 9 [Procambarus clarkii]|uniref:keratin, type I cytoskeletal 9 n=1 Tax=Procambarus clarkii TaxID=6728 RepID=UPI001E6760B4|nr:ATP-dependent RNA helicase A-like [Procambarus clarkii]
MVLELLVVFGALLVGSCEAVDGSTRFGVATAARSPDGRRDGRESQFAFQDESGFPRGASSGPFRETTENGFSNGGRGFSGNGGVQDTSNSFSRGFGNSPGSSFSFNGGPPGVTDDLTGPSSETSFGDFSNSARGTFSSPGVGGSDNSFTNVFDSGSANAIGSNDHSFDNSFGVNSGSSGTFRDFADSAAGSFGGFRGSESASGSSDDEGIGSGSFSNDGERGIVNPFPFNNGFGRDPFSSFGTSDDSFDNSFGVNGRLPGGFDASSDGRFGSLGGFRGTAGAFGSSFGGPLSSGSLPRPGLRGSENPFNNFANFPVNFFNGNEGFFDNSFNNNGQLPGDFLASEGFIGPLGGLRGTFGDFDTFNGFNGFNNNLDGSFGVPGNIIGNGGGVFLALVSPSGVFLLPSSALVSAPGVLG